MSKWALVLAIGLLVCSSGSAFGDAPTEAGDMMDERAARDAAVMAVLDRYMDALNVLDIEGHVATYHFPHYRHASGKVALWKTPEEANPMLLVPANERRARLREALEPEWYRTVWTRREIVQGDDRKVHVVTRFERQREDGSVIKTFDSLYVLTFEQGRWGIRGRSSFAP